MRCGVCYGDTRLEGDCTLVSNNMAIKIICLDIDCRAQWTYTRPHFGDEEYDREWCDESCCKGDEE